MVGQFFVEGSVNVMVWYFVIESWYVKSFVSKTKLLNVEMEDYLGRNKIKKSV